MSLAEVQRFGMDPVRKHVADYRPASRRTTIFERLEERAPPPAGYNARAMSDDAISRRKDQHLDLTLHERVEPEGVTTLLEDVHLVHCSLPELALDELDLSVTLCGRRLAAPLVVTGMTGGTARAGAINRDLAAVAERHGLAFGVGSQRIMERHPERAASFRVREVAPTVLLLGNIGGRQAAELGADGAEALMASIGADALCVHLNPAQELIQPGGDRDFRGVAAAIGALAERLGPRLVVKETGAGISPAVGARLASLGVRTVDVSGAGGTSWTRVEALRTVTPQQRALGDAFSGWGLPTGAALEGLAGSGLALIASGGIRDGLDVAKALALGATAAGMALPLLKAHDAGGVEGADAFVRLALDGLRTAMLLTGSRDVAALRASRPLVAGRLAEWRRHFEAGRP